MKKKEIFDLESGNTDRIYLHKEGMFWIAYERSAYRFVKTIRPYRVTKRHIGSVGQQMVSLGFPDSALVGIDARIIERTEKQFILQAPENPMEDAYDQWKSEIPLYVPPAKSARPDAPVTEAEAPKVSGAAEPSAPFEPGQPQQAGGMGQGHAAPAMEPVLEDIAYRIRVFNIEEKTPMECMLFVSELKNILRDALR